MKIHHHILKSLTISAAVFLIPAVVTAEIIGIEHFDYADGSVADKDGGDYWDWSENTATPSHTGSRSDWDNVFGVTDVSGGKLRTSDSSAKREFNGPGEGVTAPSDERDGAFNGDDVIYFRTTMTRQAGASWSGLSSYDFGAERLFFGVPFSENPASMQREFGLQIAGVSPAYSGTAPVDGQTYTIVAKLDFGADLLSLWVDPDLSTDEVSNNPAATVAYTGTNWSTAVRLGSGGSGTTEWDDVFVATRWDDLRPRPRIPNPSFEAGPTPAAPGYTDSIPGWQEGGAMGRTGVNPSAGGSPFANNGTIPDGNRVAFIQSTGGDLSSLSTTITGLQPDTQYRVTFRANSRESHSLPLPAWSLDGGDFVGFDADPVGGANAYRLVEGTFVSTATTASLVIVNQTDPGTDSTVLIDDFTIEADVFLTTENNGALTITGYDRNGDGTAECPVGELVIPDSIGGLPVTAIGAQAFRFCRDLTAVTLPDGLTSIGFQAFLGCNGLTSVTLPVGLTSIGFAPFAACDMLTAIEVAVGNANYSSLDGVLYNVDKTTLIQFPAGKTGAFSVPLSVASIGSLAFDGCSGLTSVTLPDGLTSIGSSAFAGCSGLTALTLPDGLTSIESTTFFDCSGLRSVTLPDSLTSIGSSAFIGCSGLTSLTLPDGLTSIGGSTFQSCSGLTSLTLPAGLTSIGAGAFIGCSALTAVYFLGDAPLLAVDTVSLFGNNVGPNAVVYYVPETGGWPAPGGIFGAGDFGGGLPTALWDPAARITSIVLNPTTIDLTWLPFLPVASPSYRVESSPDGQTWTTVPGFGDVTGATASIPRPSSTARLLLRVVGNGG